MGGLAQLLVVQEHDGAVDRLRHRREHLPERAALVEAQARLAVFDAELRELLERRDELAVRERQFEGQATLVEAKAKEVESVLYGGSVSSPRELQALQADLDQLRRRQRDLEDRELELMEEREALDGEAAELEERRGGSATEVERLSGVIAEAEEAIDAEIADELAARAAVLPGLAPDLVRLYESVRRANQGIGVARLEGGRCQGCHLSLPATEVDRIRRLPPETVARCEHCGAILVRP